MNEDVIKAHPPTAGHFSLFPAAENSVRDHRVDQLIQMMEASGEGEISSSQQSAKGRGGNVTQSMKASDKGKVRDSSQSTDLT